jgi:hypothetical protein
MVTTPGGRPSKPCRHNLLREVLIGFLQAIGLIPLKNVKLPPGAYWAKDKYGRVELRVPARSLDEPPPF